MGKNRVSYYYEDTIGHYHYGPHHPMKPHRIKLAHHLILSYGLYREMEVYKPHRASERDIQRFHSDDYISFLSKLTPNPQSRASLSGLMQRFNVGELTDCPVFDGVMDFCSIYTGASIDGAMKLNHKHTDVAINWAGGLHHAKKSEASGFCYVNDIVLAILELLKYHSRVVYIDIDIHHGDGVEEAFYSTDRVMTVSFHKFGLYHGDFFFPGTGSLETVGHKQGENYSVNFPLEEGMTDAAYEKCFKPVMNKVMEIYQPSAIVLQCGADSLTGDRLGCFNLTLKGHAECVKHMKTFGLPMLVLGGGGYTIRNVARCWAYETSILLDKPLNNQIPYNDFFEYYAPSYKLHLDQNINMENLNEEKKLQTITSKIIDNLRLLQGAPSVQFQERPPDAYLAQEDDGDKDDPDIRSNKNRMGGRDRQHESEFYDNDQDHDGNVPN